MSSSDSSSASSGYNSSVHQQTPEERIERMLEDSIRRWTRILSRNPRQAHYLEPVNSESWYQDVRYRAENPLTPRDIARKNREIRKTKAWLSRYFIAGMRQFLGDDDIADIVNVAQFGQDIHRKTRRLMIQLIEILFKIWLLEEFDFENACPLCTLLFASEINARLHIEDHFSDLAPKIVDRYLG